jgi:glycosyltransferase involved in cell wall biosynthesis
MKILEAAANSVPFITTSVGVEGLDFVNGESCIIADTPDEFAAAIHLLTNDRLFCRRLGEAANEVYKNKYTAKVLAQVRNEVYLRAPIENHREP